MKDEKGSDDDVYLRVGIILFGRKKELDKIVGYIKGLERFGRIKQFVFHTFSSELLYILKDHLVKAACQGNPEPIQKAFQDKIKK